MLLLPFRPLARLLLPLVDMALLCVGLLTALWRRTGWPPPSENWESFQVALPWTLVLGWVVYYAYGLYVVDLRTRTAVIRQVVLANLTSFVGLAVLAFWLRAFALPRSVILIAFVIQILFMTGWRVFVLAFNRWRHGQQRVLVVGSSDDCMTLAAKLKSVPRGWFQLVSSVSPDAVLVKGARCLAGVDVLLIGSSIGLESRRRLMSMAQAVNVSCYLVPDLYDIMVLSYEADQLDDIPVFRIQPLGLSTTARLTKRLFDLSVVIPMALVTAPIILVTAALVRLTSNGPAFYSQKRVGENGAVFTLWKLRSMVADAEPDGPQLAQLNDPRVTSVGRFIRATRIDELPQLWNVWMGHMSLVGPRPERPEFVEAFTQTIPDYPLRNVVKPGLTGLAQVLGKYTTTAADKFRYDIHYIRQYSIWLDCKILLLTVRVVLNREKAQGLQKEKCTTSVRACGTR